MLAEFTWRILLLLGLLALAIGYIRLSRRHRLEGFDSLATGSQCPSGTVLTVTANNEALCVPTTVKANKNGEYDPNVPGICTLSGRRDSRFKSCQEIAKALAGKCPPSKPAYVAGAGAASEKGRCCVAEANGQCKGGWCSVNGDPAKNCDAHSFVESLTCPSGKTPVLMSNWGAPQVVCMDWTDPSGTCFPGELIDRMRMLKPKDNPFTAAMYNVGGARRCK
jgi:hypothetical protein